MKMDPIRHRKTDEDSPDKASEALSTSDPIHRMASCEGIRSDKKKIEFFHGIFQ